jgi:hypothetical protein
VPSKPEVSPLHKQLDSFGRRGRRLTAARLKRCPGVLVALFGQEALADADAEQILAERVERAILAIIAGINDERDRRIAEAVFCAKPEFYGLNVDARQRKIKDMGGGDLRERYKTQRARIVSDVADALQRMCGAQKAADRDALLSPEARRAARQLYRYAQHALVRVEAYNLCIRFAHGLRGNFRRARAANVDPKHLAHGWLAEHGKGDDSFRLAPNTRSMESDPALWALAYCYRYLRTLLRDPTGRDYLRENLPLECWRSIQLGAPFQSAEVDKMLSVLAESQIDEDYAFVDNLCQDDQGRSIHEKWLVLLTTETSQAENWGKSADARQLTAGDREQLIFDLLMLCIALQNVFPPEALISPEENSRLAIGMIIDRGLTESRKSDDDYDDDDAEKEEGLVDHLLRLRPPMYLSDEDEFVWSDARPQHDPWAEFH